VRALNHPLKNLPLHAHFLETAPVIAYGSVLFSGEGQLLHAQKHVRVSPCLVLFFQLPLPCLQQNSNTNYVIQTFLQTLGVLTNILYQKPNSISNQHALMHTSTQCHKQHIINIKNNINNINMNTEFEKI
jgi:hypothetical protein